MTEAIKDFMFLCPFCKEVINFQMKSGDLESKLSGGLTGVEIPAHGDPAHTIQVYIDRQGLIRAAYPEMVGKSEKGTLQFSYIIDATSEITPDEGKATGVNVLPFTVVIDKEPERCYNEEIFFPEIYKHLKAEKRVRSFPVKVERYLEAFKAAPDDKPIIVLLVSRTYSEGYANAEKAKKIFAKENPEKASRIHLINSKTTGPLLKLMMKNVLKMDEEGKSLADIIDYLYWVSEKHISYIYVDSLKALRQSERVGRVTSFFGTLLGIKPIIVENLNGDGDLVPLKTVRGKEQAIQEITKGIQTDYKGKELVGVIFYGITIDDANKLQKELTETVSDKQDEITMDFIGTGVAIHLSYDILGISLYPKPPK